MPRVAIRQRVFGRRRGRHEALGFKDSTLADLYSEADAIFQLAFAFEKRDAELRACNP